VKLALVVGVIVLCAAAVAGAGAQSTARSAGCAWGAVRAGKLCLVDGHSCSARSAASDRRHGFACRAGVLRFDWSVLRRRPLVSRRIDPGAPCPTSPRTGDLAAVGLRAFPAWGTGPAYPAFDPPQPTPQVAVEYGPGVEYAEWGEHKVLWAIDPRYVGETLVRGHALDGPDELRFENGAPGFTEEQRRDPATELRFVGGYARPAVTRVRTPGCYAYQIDGIGFSRTIVFEAVAA
jgi:hypothetical protein